MIHKLQAVVLWSRRSREADKLVGLYTDTLGRVTARAVGAAKPTAKFASLTEPFVQCDLALYLLPGQGWGKIVGGQMRRSFPGLRLQVGRSTAAAWVCEILYRLTPEVQPSLEKFNLAVETLEALERASTFGAIRLAFAVRFLALAGFGLENRDPWIRLRERSPERARALCETPLAVLGDTLWNAPEVTALEALAGAVVMDHLTRPLQVNRFRQMMGVEI